MNRKLKLAIIGTNGIPAKYGGFETLVEYLVQYLAVDFDITVYCSTQSNKEKITYYKGVNLKYIRLSANGWQSIFFDFFSLLRSYRNFDKILILGCSGSIFQPLFFLYKRKFIMNLGGLDWQRSKWNYLTRKYLKFSEKLAVKYSGYLISDNLGIKEYLINEYGIDSIIIPYGGDHVRKYPKDQEIMIKYPFLKKKYALAVARIQPDNNIEMLCEAFNLETPFPLIIIGNWNNSRFGIELKNKYSEKKNLVLLDAIYNQMELNIIRSNSFVYIHGHSAGGTNPALVEAMSLELPVFAFDNNFNRFTTENLSFYFTNFTSLNQMICETDENDLKQISSQMYLIAKSKYTWTKVCSDYAIIINKA